MGSQGFGSNPIVGGYRGLSRAMLTFFQQAPAHCQAVLDKMHRDLANANAREQERQSSGHEFDSKTGVWTPGSSSTAQPTPRPSVKSITQDSPMPLDGAQRLQSAASVPPKK